MQYETLICSSSPQPEVLGNIRHQKHNAVLIMAGKFVFFGEHGGIT